MHLRKLHEVRTIEVSGNPNICPYCKNNMVPIRGEFYDTKKSGVVGVSQCSNLSCLEPFLSFYEYVGLNSSRNSMYKFKGTMQGDFKKHEFHEEIDKISPTFTIIFNQALQAEHHELSEIAGVGFRKSLEFLLKDFCIHLSPQDSDKIKDLSLANCIKGYIQNPNIKSSAERATWLGNDETHYTRKWEDKEILHLKELIFICVYWIITEQLTKKYIEEMP